ncbi:MAG: glycosyltransferase [Candidatus Omnitrophota bacterium]|nr:glycosyltransferase [Candidatus Omnitrophota bacterium]
MKIIQVPFCFYPDLSGGTEVYVEALARRLTELQIQTVIAAPAVSEKSYLHRGLPVERFSVAEPASLEELYGEGDPVAEESFSRILEKHKPDLVHLHAFTRAVSLRLVRQVRRRGIPVVFTYHTPTVSCQRGTLMRWGKEVCDGVLRLGTCTRCTLQGLGIPRPAADLIGSIPVPVGEALQTAGFSGGAWTAFRMRSLVSRHHKVFRSMVGAVTRIVAVSEWVQELLVRNGVDPEKIVLCRQGLAQVSLAPALRRRSGSPIRIAAFGRMDPAKGFHLLVKAVKKLPGLPIVLDIYGIEQGKAGVGYGQAIRRAAKGDTRIRVCEPVPSAEIIRCLREYDLLAVPSLGMETGPLVVLEAFAAGVPVLGSRLGGIAELVRDNVNGLLVESGSVSEWKRGLDRICSQPALLERLRKGITPPRTMDDVTQEMKALYRQVVGE